VENLIDSVIADLVIPTPVELFNPAGRHSSRPTRRQLTVAELVVREGRLDVIGRRRKAREERISK